ncbi:hypothetical protein V2W45_1347982 [Cenococcum geophilum]
MAPRLAFLAAFLSVVPLVAGHGHVLASSPTASGWPCDNLDNGFIAPDAFASADIICHKSTTNGQAYATATAGRVTGWGELYLEVNECGICIVRDLGR